MSGKEPSTTYDDFEDISYAGDKGGPTMINTNSKYRSMRDKICKNFVKLYLLPLMLIIAMILGIGIGFMIRSVDESMIGDKRRIMYLNYPGELLMRMLKCMILPLIFFSLVAGMSGLPATSAGKLGGRTVAYYFLTTFM